VHDCASELEGVHLTATGPSHLSLVEQGQEADAFGTSPDQGKRGCFGVLCGLGRSHSAGKSREEQHKSAGQGSMYVKAMF
jgi:hypothetical protein